jgi:hypothetical protein
VTPIDPVAGEFVIRTAETVANVKVCRRHDKPCLTIYQSLLASLMSIPYYLSRSETDLPRSASRRAPYPMVRLELAAFHRVTPRIAAEDVSEEGARMARLAALRDAVIAKTAMEWGISADELKNYLNAEAGLILSQDFPKAPEYDLALAYLYREQYDAAHRVVKNLKPETDQGFRYRVLDAYLLYATGDVDGAMKVTEGLLKEHPNDGVLRSNLKAMRSQEEAVLTPPPTTCVGNGDQDVPQFTNLPIPPIQNHPFTAIERSTATHIEAGSVTSCQVMSLTFARDSNGSVHAESGTMAHPVPWDPQPNGTVTDIYVTDPATQNETHCPKSGGTCHTYRVAHLDTPGIFLEPSDVQSNGKFVCLRATETLPGKPDCDVIDLGTKKLYGLLVRGQRIVRNIDPPKDSKGMVHEEEIWYSPDLQLDLLDIRWEWSGTVITMRFTDLKLEEPDASLFASHQ